MSVGLFNNVILNTQEKVVIVIDLSQDPSFAVNGLNNFDEIVLKLCSETYSTVDNPENLYVNPEDSSELILSIGFVTQLSAGKRYTPNIVGYYDGGKVKVINSTNFNFLNDPIEIVGGV